MAELHMDEDTTQYKNNDVLLMLSGGRDSFLSACRLIEDGKRVHMITYDNGCMSNAIAAKTVADRIVKKYGEDKAKFIGVHRMAPNLYRLQEAYLYQTISETSRKYPDLRPTQMTCLACHTAMYIESIAYCKAHNISYISEGARESQKFFVELPEMVARYHALAQAYHIDVVLPVYDLTDDWDRKLELADRGFIPKTLEPQCWIGCPLRSPLSALEIASLAAYYDDEIEPKLKGLIDASIHRLEADGEAYAYQEG